jgi:hypothetical protein
MWRARAGGGQSPPTPRIRRSGNEPWEIAVPRAKSTQRHSDNEKFRNGLNEPQGCKMSEWPLSMLRNSTTSNLNTSFDAYLTPRLIVIVSRMVGEAGTVAIGEDWSRLRYPWAHTSRGRATPCGGGTYRPRRRHRSAGRQGRFYVGQVIILLLNT